MEQRLAALYMDSILYIIVVGGPVEAVVRGAAPGCLYMSFTIAMWMFGYLASGQLDVAGGVASENHHGPWSVEQRPAASYMDSTIYIIVVVGPVGAVVGGAAPGCLYMNFTLAMWMFGCLALGQLDVAGSVASANHYEP